jgi:hypothetical protein
MDTSCSKIVKSFLLYQNTLYAFSFPISMILAIIVYGICVSMKCTSNSYMLQIIIPILTLILVNLLIDVISNLMIDPNEVNQLTSMCISRISKKTFHEDFEQQDQNNQNSKQIEMNMNNSEELRSPLNIIDNLYGGSVQVINQDSKQYTLPYNGMNSENFCKIA